MSPQSIPTLVVLIGLALPAAASGYTLGSSDAPYPPPAAMAHAKALGATTGRILVDPTRPLGATYDAAVQIRRNAGVRPQLIVGGMATKANRPRHLRLVARATVRVFKRYPDAYSISMFNEPDLAGVDVCRYARVFRRTYRTLKRLGAERVLLGEVMANDTTDWLRRWHDCDQPAGDGFAWHGYGLIPDLPGAPMHWGNVARLARSIGLEPYITEFGVPTRGAYAKSEREAAALWGDALGRADAISVQELVVYHVSEAGSGSRWDTSLVDSHGRPRLAFATIAAAR